MSRASRQRDTATFCARSCRGEPRSPLAALFAYDHKERDARRSPDASRHFHKNHNAQIEYKVREALHVRGLRPNPNPTNADRPARLRRPPPRLAVDPGFPVAKSESPLGLESTTRSPVPYAHYRHGSGRRESGHIVLGVGSWAKDYPTAPHRWHPLDRRSTWAPCGKHGPLRNRKTNRHHSLHLD